MDQDELKEFLDFKVSEYNNRLFIGSDPLSVPHRFSEQNDIEISAYLTATIAWGQRKTIIQNAVRLVQLMDDSPYEFLLNAGNVEWKRFLPFVHRTFNGIDCIYVLRALQNIYRNYGGMQKLFEQLYTAKSNLYGAMIGFREIFLSAGDPGRTARHIANIENNSAGKRMNMYLRWMVRQDKAGVDFGLWKGIPPSELFIPLDVHSGNVARKLNLLKRNQNDWKAVELLTDQLRKFDPEDPVRYDYALFGLGVFEKF